MDGGYVPLPNCPNWDDEKEHPIYTDIGNEDPTRLHVVPAGEGKWKDQQRWLYLTAVPAAQFVSKINIGTYEMDYDVEDTEEAMDLAPDYIMSMSSPDEGLPIIQCAVCKQLMMVWTEDDGIVKVQRISWKMVKWE